MLHAQEIIAAAEENVGVEDTDSGAAENLRQLVASLDDSVPVSGAGEARIRASLMMGAVNRLGSLSFHSRHHQGAPTG